jgi:DNA-binding MurR/RpiR family transcriptional regulator
VTKIEDLISARFDELSAQQRRAARFILDHQDDVALRSMRELASKAALPPVTFVRLARALGFDDYLGLRALFQDRVRQGEAGRRYTPRAREMQRSHGGQEVADLARRMFAADLDNIERTDERNEPAALLDAVQMLERAERVFVLGQRSCFPAAYLFHYVVRLFRQDTLLVRGSIGTVADDLRGVGTGDVLLAISVEPYTAEVVRAARYAKSEGARLLGITDTQLSPIARIADKSLLAACETPSFFHSVTALTALMQSLVALLVTRGGERAVSAIEASERQLDRFGAYWSDDGSEPG